MSTSSWIKIGEGTFERPLSTPEFGFHLDSFVNRTADFSCAIQVQTSHQEVFSKPNVEQAWCRTKVAHPLLSAVIEPRDNTEDGGGFAFVVSEDRINGHVDGQIRWMDSLPKEGFEEIYQVFSKEFLGPNQILSPTSLSQLWIFEHSENSKEDKEGEHHVFTLFFLLAHSIGDVGSIFALQKTFLQALSEVYVSSTTSTSSTLQQEEKAIHPHPRQPTWDENLELYESATFFRNTTLSPAIKRWRDAAAQIILRRRQSLMHGGQTIPTVLHPSHRLTVASDGGTLTHLFSPTVTAHILARTRSLSVTWNQVLSTLALVSEFKILWRLYNDEKISEKEMMWRLKQPAYFAGPARVRREGEGEVQLALIFYLVRTVGLPRPEKLWKKGKGKIEWADILSRERFGMRARFSQGRIRDQLSHPLAPELGRLAWNSRIGHNKTFVKAFQQHQASTTSVIDDEIDPQWQIRKVPLEEDMDKLSPFTFTVGGSTWGDISRQIPTQYPLNLTCPSETIIKAINLENFRVDLRPRHGEMYLGSYTLDGKLKIFLKFDQGVWDKELMEEWMNELVDAAKWYLDVQE